MAKANENITKTHTVPDDVLVNELAVLIEQRKLQRKKDLHVVDGISGLDGYIRFTKEQRLLMGDTTESVEPWIKRIC